MTRHLRSTTTTATDSPSSISSYTVSEPQRTEKTLSHPIIHQQKPAATHQSAPQHHHNALHQTLRHAAKQEPVREVTGPPSSPTITAIPEEIITFLRFFKIIYMNDKVTI